MKIPKWMTTRKEAIVANPTQSEEDKANLAEIIATENELATEEALLVTTQKELEEWKLKHKELEAKNLALEKEKEETHKSILAKESSAKVDEKTIASQRQAIKNIFKK